MNTDALLKIRSDFPLLSKKIRGKSLVYLDSAASALKPWRVIERISQFYTYETANVHRGAHYLGDQATLALEEGRKKIAQFVNAADMAEIIATKGTTESINLVAHSYGGLVLKTGDEVLISEMEHHSNIVPWQMACEKAGAILTVAQIQSNGDLDYEDFQKKLSRKTKIVAITGCSNTLGTIVDLKRVIKASHEVGAVVVVDAAQLVANEKIDVQDLDCDFLAFSGHKLFGPYGVGVLYGKRELLEEMPSYQYGGSMINRVSFKGTTFHDVPFRFEAGTPNIGGIIAMKPAMEYVEALGWDRIHSHEQELLKYATSRVKEIKGLRIYGEAPDKAAIISFTIEGLHPADVGQILDQENVAVRVGHHCTMPLMEKLGINGTIRASFSVYNNAEDVEKFCQALVKAQEMLS